MKTRWTKVADIGWMIAALLLMPLVLVTGAQAQKYAAYRVDGKELTDQEKYVLAQNKKGEIADLLEKFVLPHIPEKDRERARELGLAGYVEKLDAKEREAFLEQYGDGLRIRAGFLETLLIEGFPGFKIHRHGVRIANALIEEPLDFEGAEVDQAFGLPSSILRGGAIFQDSWFKKILLLNGVHFVGEANFHRVKVGKSLFVRKTIFQGPVDFGSADIKGQFNADGAKFESKENKANFNAMKVGQSAFFREAVFQGPVGFGNVDIKRQFVADKAQFLHETPADFEGIKVELPAFFRDAVFQGVINMNDASFLDLLINPKTSSPPIPQINLERTVVQRELKIGNAKIDIFQASHLQVKGPATFENVTMGKSVDLRDSTFQNLNLIDATWPEDEKEVRLEGMTYNAINAGPGKDDWKKLLAWINGSRFNTQIYGQLENYFQRGGHKELADKVFISGKRREWRESWSRNFWEWPGNILRLILWDGGVGYGRNPFRAVYISLVFVIIGTWIFSRPGVLTWDNCQLGEKIGAGKAFWFSLDMFLPVVSLGPDKIYQIKPEAMANLPYCLRGLKISPQSYSYVHQLMGYVLVSIGLAAVTGIIKQ